MVPARRIGGYALLGQLGLSGTAEVFEAQPVGGGEPVAIKRLLPHALEMPEVRARFDQEVQATLANTHRGLSRGLEVIEGPAPEGQRGDPCLVMTLIRGEALSARLGGAALHLDALAHAARGLASSLRPLHEAATAHGDISGRNVLVDEAGDFTWIDLGSAGPDGSPATDAGTPRYASPERDEHGLITLRGDVHGLGILLWELAAGQRWPTDSPPTALPQGCPATGTALGDLIERCLSREPEARPANAAEFLRALDAAGVDTQQGRQAWGRPSASTEAEPSLSTTQGILAWAALVSALAIAVWTAAWFIAQTR